jgi:hypothetical protein
MGKMMITNGIWGVPFFSDQIEAGSVRIPGSPMQGKKLVDINKAGLDLEKSTSAG